MVNHVFAPMIIAARIRRYFGRFENAGAVSADKAKTLQSLGLDDSILFRRLLRNKVFIESHPGHYYVVKENFKRYQSLRRVKVLTLTGGLVICIVTLSYFMY